MSSKKHQLLPIFIKTLGIHTVHVYMRRMPKLRTKVGVPQVLDTQITLIITIMNNTNYNNNTDKA